MRNLISNPLLPKVLYSESRPTQIIVFHFMLTNRLTLLFLLHQINIDIGLFEDTVLHINLVITRFVITRFWIQHGSKMDPKNV